MNKHMRAVVDRRLERTVKALEKNRFEAGVVESKEALLEELRRRIPPGASCSVGGSVTLFETGVIDFLKGGGYRYLDRYAEGADQKQVFYQALGCDVYLTSTNAVTEDGKLYNMDGRGNRVAAMVYGPEKVIVVAGYNKIVPDVEAARQRNRQIAAPANCARLGKATPCAQTGRCEDCRSPDRICVSELVSGCQMIPGRICVLLLPLELGF